MADDDSSDYEDQADGATGAGTEAVQGTPESTAASRSPAPTPASPPAPTKQRGIGSPRDGVRLPKNPGV